MPRHAPKPPGLPHAPRTSAAKGKKTPKIKELYHRTPTHDEQDALHEAALNGPPIVTALLGQAMVELELENLLRRKLKCSDQLAWIRLADEGGPLDTFNRKILLGRALGLYTDSTVNHLKIIRNVRNIFAHSKVLIDFSDDPIDKEIRSAVLPVAKSSTIYEYIKYARSAKYSSRDAYVWLCVACYAVLVRKYTRSLTAQTSHLKRRVQVSQKGNAFSFGFADQEGTANILASLLRNQTADPNPLALQLGGLLGPFPSEKSET